MLQTVRSRTMLLVALGDCAVTGNVTALRNGWPHSDQAILNRAYQDPANINPPSPPPLPHPRQPAPRPSPQTLHPRPPPTRNRQSRLLHPRLPPQRRPHQQHPKRTVSGQNTHHGGKLKVWLKKPST
jgi:NAD-reducing hydrogenase small subunit